MSKLAGMCSHFIEVVGEKLCFRNGGAKDKKKPTINVTQALQMNQQEEDTKEKQLPAIKPNEILKRGIEDLLRQLKNTESQIEYYIRNTEAKQLGKSGDMSGPQDFGGYGNFLINITDENQIEDEEDKENFNEFKKSTFYKTLQDYMVDKKKAKKKKDELRLDDIVVEQQATKKDGFFQEVMSSLKNVGEKDKRKFNSNILKDDPQIKDVLSFTALSIINNKLCEPESFLSTQASDMFLQDATEWVKDIDLIYVISSKGDQHLMQETKKNNNFQTQTNFPQTQVLIQGPNDTQQTKENTQEYAQSEKPKSNKEKTGQSAINTQEALTPGIKSLKHLDNVSLPRTAQNMDDPQHELSEHGEGEEEEEEDGDNPDDYSDISNQEAGDKENAQNKLLEVIQNALANITQQKKELNKQTEKTGIIRRTVWFAKNSKFRASRLQVEITWIDGTIAEVANYFEQDFKQQKKIREKYQMMQSQFVLKVIHRAYYQQQIFFGSLLYIAVEVKETGEHTLKNLIQQRHEQEIYYKDVEVAYIIQVMNTALQEAKKLNVYHSNISDQSIYYFPDIRSYKIGDFMFYDFDKDFRKIGNTPQSRNRVSERIDSYQLMFHAPEILKIYKKNIQNYDRQKEETDNFNRDIQRRQLDFLKNLHKQLDNQGHFNQHQSYPKTITDFDEVYDEIKEFRDYLNPTVLSKMRMLITGKQEQIKKELESGSIDVHKADIYSLGMVAIKLILRGRLEEIYKSKRTPKEKFLRIFKSIQSQKQFQKLVPLLKKMVAFNPEKRFTHQQIEGYIQQLKKPPVRPSDELFVEEENENVDSRRLYTDLKGEKNRQKEAIYNLYKIAQGYFDLRRYKQAGKIYKDLINNHDILVEHLQLDRILQIQFQLALVYYERRKLANAKMIFFDSLQLSKEYIEKNELDIRYYRPIFYLSSIAFMEEDYQAAYQYIDKLRILTESYLDKYFFWSKCMLYVLESKILGDSNNHVLAVRKLKQIYNQAGQWCIQNNFNQELYIEIIYNLGIQYLFLGLYKQSEKAFKLTLKCVKDRNNQFLLQETVLMSMGYLSTIGFQMNELKNLSSFTQKSYDKIQVYLRSDGDYVDTILKWLDKFGQFLPVTLVSADIKQFIEIFQVGVNKVQKNLFHNEIHIYYIMAKALYYAGDIPNSTSKFLDALQVYNESSKVMLEYQSSGLRSTYKTRQQIIFTKLENEKNKKQKLLEMERDKLKFRFYQFKIHIFNQQKFNKALIGNIYDWLCYLFYNQNKLPQSKDCFVNYENILSQEEKTNESLRVKHYLRLGKIYFQYQNYEMSIQSLAKGLEILNSMPKYQLSYSTKKVYSEIVNLSGLIALILGLDEIGFRRFDEGLKQFQQVVFHDKSEQESPKLKSAAGTMSLASPTPKDSPLLLKLEKSPSKNSITKKLETIKVKREEDVNHSDIVDQLQKQDENAALNDLLSDEDESEGGDEDHNGEHHQGEGGEMNRFDDENEGERKKATNQNDIEKNYRYQLDLDDNDEDEKGAENIDDSQSQYFLINNYIDITLNCIYIGLYEQGLKYLEEGFNKIFVNKSKKSKKKTNILSEIDFRFLLGYVNGLSKKEYNSLYHFHECFLICQTIYDRNVVNKPSKQRYAVMGQYVSKQFCKLGIYKEAFAYQDQSEKVIHKEKDLVNVFISSICQQLNKYKEAENSIKEARRYKSSNPQEQLIIETKAAEIKLKFDQEESIKIYQQVISTLVDEQSFKIINNSTKAYIMKSLARFILEVDEQFFNVQKLFIFSQCLNYSFKFFTICDNFDGMMDCIVMFADMYFNTSQYEFYDLDQFKLIKERVEKMKLYQGKYDILENKTKHFLFHENLIHQADIIRIFTKCNYHLYREHLREFDAMKEQLTVCKSIYEICLFQNSDIPHYKYNDTLMYLHILELQQNQFDSQVLKVIDIDISKICSYFNSTLKSYHFNVEDITFAQMVQARCKLCHSSLFRSYILYQRFIYQKGNKGVPGLLLERYKDYKKKVKKLVEEEKNKEYLDFFAQYYIRLDKKKTVQEQEKEFLCIIFGEPSFTTQFKSVAKSMSALIGYAQTQLTTVLKAQITQPNATETSQMNLDDGLINLPDRLLIENQKEYIQAASQIIWQRVQNISQNDHPFKQEMQQLLQLIGKFRDYFRE